MAWPARRRSRPRPVGGEARQHRRGVHSRGRRLDRTGRHCLRQYRAAIAVLPSCWSGSSRRRRCSGTCSAMPRRSSSMWCSSSFSGGCSRPPPNDRAAPRSHHPQRHPGGVRPDAHASGHPALDLHRGGKAGVGRRARVAGAVLHNDPPNDARSRCSGTPRPLSGRCAPRCAASSSRRTTQPLPLIHGSRWRACSRVGNYRGRSG